jgi:hypothetical protein
MNRKRLAVGLAIVVGLGFVLTVLAIGDTEAGQCTLESVKGEFGATFTGAITAGDLAGPYAAVARIICDGEGSCYGEGTQSLNGTILPLVDQGTTYTVTPECTGSITVDLVDGPTIHFNFIIVDNGKEIRSIQTDPGTAVTGNLRKQGILLQ